MRCSFCGGHLGVIEHQKHDNPLFAEYRTCLRCNYQWAKAYWSDLESHEKNRSRDEVIRDIAKDYGLDKMVSHGAHNRMEEFVDFIKNRFDKQGDYATESYIAEWAERFKKSTEWQSGDSQTRKALMKTASVPVKSHYRELKKRGW